MKADYIVKNATVFTSDSRNPSARAFAVKDGKFIYVGDEAGLSGFEGEVKDLGGKFVMPGLLDAHVHICSSVCGQYAPRAQFVAGASKQECLAFIADYIKDHPDQDLYKFMMGLVQLGGEKLNKADLDAICSDHKIIILEGECHSLWCNSLTLQEAGVTEDTEDIVPGLSYYERDENGKMTGYLIEMTEMPITLSHSKTITKEQIRHSLDGMLKFLTSHGVTTVFEAATPGALEFHERVYEVLCELDNEGKLPINVEGSYTLYDPKQFDGAIEGLKSYNRRFHTEHVKARTMKIMMDGTLGIRTACLVNPYTDTGTTGNTVITVERLTQLLKDLNENGFDLHVHSVGEGAVRTVLDATENAKRELGDAFKMQITCAHIEIMCDEDIERFAELGVFANFTPFWHGGNCISGGHEKAVSFLGEERADKMYRCITMWNTGATVTWSSDSVMFNDYVLDTWNPYVGFEVGMTRKDLNLAAVPGDYSTVPFYPQAKECISVEQMILGYTINSARQLRLDGLKGSIEAGKDADFLVFGKSLLDMDPKEIRLTVPESVYLRGKLCE